MSYFIYLIQYKPVGKNMGMWSCLPKVCNTINTKHAVGISFLFTNHRNLCISEVSVKTPSRGSTGIKWNQFGSDWVELDWFKLNRFGLGGQMESSAQKGLMRSIVIQWN